MIKHIHKNDQKDSTARYKRCVSPAIFKNESIFASLKKAGVALIAASGNDFWKTVNEDDEL